MSVQFAIPAAEAPAAVGHGEAHSTATFRALIARQHRRRLRRHRHQPALRAARGGGCRRGTSAAAAPQAVLGVLSLILWALIVVVTLKYVVILLRADNNGEGGTLALMALAQRAWAARAGAIVLLGIVCARAVLRRRGNHAGAVGIVGDRGHQARHRRPSSIIVVPLTVIILVALFAVQSRGTARVAALFGPVMCVWFVAIAVAGRAADRAPIPKCCWRSIRSMPYSSCSTRHDRLDHARRGVPRRHRRGGALCRPRPFRQAADPDRLARAWCCRRSR